MEISESKYSQYPNFQYHRPPPALVEVDIAQDTLTQACIQWL